jgi:hypothetical protein
MGLAILDLGLEFFSTLFPGLALRECRAPKPAVMVTVGDLSSPILPFIDTHMDTTLGFLLLYPPPFGLAKVSGFSIKASRTDLANRFFSGPCLGTW